MEHSQIRCFRSRADVVTGIPSPAMERLEISINPLDVDELTSTLLQFDIVNLDGAVQKELLDSIQKEGIVIYEKRRIFEKTEVSAD